MHPASETDAFDAAKITGAFGMAENAEKLLKKMRDSCPKYIPTGFPELDGVLNGGLTASLYVLGAMPSLGKSTFLINMSEKIACGETAVLYFSLEMPADHIARGTFCRCLFNAKKEKNGLSEAKRMTASASDFLKASSFDEEKLKTFDEEKEIWDKAFKQYKKTGENFYVIDRNYISDYTQDESTISASFVSKFVKDFKDEHGDKDIVVIMDYLQLLRPEKNMKNPTERNVIDHSIAELWKIAHSNKIPVIAISSINRASYSEPVTLSSFKESGGIEFSADVVWGLQLKGAGEKNNKEPAETKDHRDMQLVVLKNRYGSRDHNIGFRFYTRFGIYIEDKELSAEIQNSEQSDPKADTAAAAAKTKTEAVSASIAADAPADKSAKKKKTESSTPNKSFKGYINNTKIANELRDEHIKTGEKHSLHIDKKRKFYVTYKLTYKGTDKSGENKSLTFMDCAVMDAVLSHYYNHREKNLIPAGFTVSGLLKFMTGRDRITNSNTKRSIEEKIERSLLKLNDMEMTIDVTEECEMRYIDEQTKENMRCLLKGEELAAAAKDLGVNDKPEERIILRGRLLPLSQGGEKGSFRIEEGKEPLLYEYSNDKINKQIITYSPELLKTDNMHLSETAILERYYLIHKIKIREYNEAVFQKITLYDYRNRYSGMIPKVTSLSYDGSYSDYIDSDDFKRIRKNIINETVRSLEYLKDRKYIEAYTVKNNEIDIKVNAKK